MFRLIFLCAIIFIDHETGAVMDPGYEYIEGADTWLRLHLAPARWQDALVRCKLEGGVLASPSTTLLTKAMMSMMASYKNVLSLGVFTGIHDLISEGDFMSLDGIPVSDIQLDWAYNKHSDNNEETHCVILKDSGEVTDVSCVSKYPYFCRKENGTMVVNKDCHTTAVGYEYNTITGSCYKFHRLPQTWHRAARVCHAEGGHLAIVNSKMESEVIKEIFVLNPTFTIIGADFDYVASIGAWKWNDENGEWMTIYGQTLNEAGFAVWGDNQPNNNRGNQTICAIERDGTLNDAQPMLKLAFICEITP